MITYDAALFTWAGTHGVTEVTELLDGPWIISRPPYPLVLKGRERTVHFVLKQAVEDEEGDVTGWAYEAPGTPFTLFVVND